MKTTRNIKLFITTIITLCCCGCSTIQQTIELGNVSVNAPIAPPPTHVRITNKPGDVTLSPKILINGQKKIEAATDNYYRGNTTLPDGTKIQINQKNLEWNIPSLMMGVDFDICVAGNLSIFGGFHYNEGGQKSLTGGNFGLGFFDLKDERNIRIDLGFLVQNYSYDAFTIVTTKTFNTWDSSSEKNISYYHDRSTNMNLNGFVTLTLNSAMTETKLNYFLSAGYFTQQLLGFEPRGNIYLFAPNFSVVDLRPECTAGFLLINPGVTYSISENAKFNF